MIHPLAVGPKLTTGRTPTSGVVQFSGFGLNPGDQKYVHGPPFDFAGSRFLRNGLEFCNIWNRSAAAVN